MKIQNPKSAAPAHSFSEEVGASDLQNKEIEDLFFSDQILDGEAVKSGNRIHPFKTLSYNTDQLKARLRRTISRNLVDGLVIPELVEGLVEFLVDIVREDPQQARLLGVYD